MEGRRKIFQVGRWKVEGRFSRLEAWKLEDLKEDFPVLKLGRWKIRRKIFQVEGRDAWKVQVET